MAGLIRKNVFMENNIVTSEYFMSIKVKNLVSFFISKIAKKNIMFSMRSKFMSNMHVDSKCMTPKNLKMMEQRWFVIKAFERNFVAKEWSGKMIN
jgi:hypothetical protein